MSSVILRSRDEGALARGQGDNFGLPVDVDLSWKAEAFSIASRARVSLAEIVMEMDLARTVAPQAAENQDDSG